MSDLIAEYLLVQPRGVGSPGEYRSSDSAPGRAEQAGDLGYGRYRLAGAMVLACLSSSQARCSAAVALLCSQRSPLSPARHCQARAWAIRFRAATSAGSPPQSSSWAEYVAAGIGVPSIPGSGRPASGRRVWDGIEVFSTAGGDRCGSPGGRQRSFAMGWGLALRSEPAPQFAARGLWRRCVAMFGC